MRGFDKPKAVVLEPEALDQEATRMVPPPKEFTHEVIRREPYFSRAKPAAVPAGHFAGGTKVLVLSRRGRKYCRVADRRGRCGEVDCGALRKL